MAGAGADRSPSGVTSPAAVTLPQPSVPMLTEPASAQRDAFEFPGIPIPPTVTYPERYPARKTTRSDPESPIGPAVASA
jgi:hypothetical protein